MREPLPAPVTLSREELHQKVWETPMTRLASQFGLSDVGLAKICKKHRIPRPPRGYWARRAVGRAWSREPLPPLKSPLLQIIKIRPQPSRRESAELARVVAQQRQEKPIVVPKRLSKPHPLVKNTIQALRRGQSNEHGLIWAGGRDVLAVVVSRAAIGRAMRIMHALVGALERQGHSLLSKTDDSGRRLVCAVVQDEEIGFELREKLQQRPHVLTAEEKRRMARKERLFLPRYDLSPSGRLSLQISTNCSGRIQTSFQDGKRQTLEDCLNRVMTSFLCVADRLKADRRQREEDLRRRAEWERQRHEKLDLIYQEERRIKALHAEAEAWSQSQRIRAYIKAVREAFVGAQIPVKRHQDLEEWLRWAEQEADRLDPLKESPASIVDEKSRWECF